MLTTERGEGWGGTARETTAPATTPSPHSHCRPRGAPAALLMGVTGLWPLLEPVGRRINVETLSNKRLAIGEGEGRGHGA